MADPDNRIIAYEIFDVNDMPIRTAPVNRDWMDHSDQRFAYRCLPLAIANQAGWMVHTAAAFSVVWDGGPYRDNVRIQFPPRLRPRSGQGEFSDVVSFNSPVTEYINDQRIISHFVAGTFTIAIPYLFRTPQGINLWVKGPTNWIKDGAQPLEGIVETDWLPATFTMNWRLTRPNYLVHFEAGDPICMIVPVPRGLAESLVPVRLPLSSAPDLKHDYDQWQESRRSFNENLERRQPEATQRGWQRDYVKGVTPSGMQATEHQTRLQLREFT